MRNGAAISAMLHGVIIVLIVVGLPRILQSERREIVPIAVEIITPDELASKPQPSKPVTKKSMPKPASSTMAQKPMPPPPATTPRKQAAKIPDPQPAPKLKPSLEPEADPLPKPKPKPKVKPIPPRPKPKPQEVKVAMKSVPSPRPKRKPRPPADAFQSLLKNLAKEQEKRKSAPVRQSKLLTKHAEGQPKRSPLEQRRIARGLVQAIRQQIGPCWKMLPGAKDAAKLQVAIRMRFNPDGSLGAAPRIEDQRRMRSDPFFRAVAESALRALRDPTCVPIKLPYENYDVWKEIVFTFDPREALGQ